jgi:hypothetical protein
MAMKNKVLESVKGLWQCEVLSNTRLQMQEHSCQRHSFIKWLWTRKTV